MAESNKRTQQDRVLGIKTALEEDELLLKGLQLTEELGRPFICELDLRSENPLLDFDKIVGHNATVRINRPDGKVRYINGYISRFVQEGLGGRGTLSRYRATLVPWIWFLTRTSTCQIFQEMTAPDIIQEVFRQHGFADFELALTATYAKREYTVQYRETAFEFVSRLMEEEGIYYFHAHENGKHSLVIADSPAAHEPAEGLAEVSYAGSERSFVGRERLWEWNIERQVQPTKMASRDFNFTLPQPILDGNDSVERKHGAAGFEIYEYPGAYADKDNAKHISMVRMEEHSSRHEIIRARGDVRGLFVGAKFKLREHPREDQAREYVVISAHCHASADDYTTGADGETVFQMGIACVEATVPFRPQRTTPRPVVTGPQTATVVGPSGEEIFTDEYGRVKVQFHWDRLGKADEKSSCFVRVAHAAAGKKWGLFTLPRIGHEVVIEFLEGDPDRPIITGAVYNANNMPPYKQPDFKTITAFKSNSSKGGGGFNELRFEDKKGEEQIFIHGEKNIDIRLKNDRFEYVGNNHHEIVHNDRMTKIENDDHSTVVGEQRIEIGKDQSLKVKAKQAVHIIGPQSTKVEGDVAHEYDSNASTIVESDLYIKADNICIEGKTNVTIKVGQSSIAIESGGIKIATTGDIVFDAKGKLEGKGLGGLKLETPATGEVKASMMTVKGDGMLTLKGGMVMIN